ncbi:MAG: HEAT repeat domain-containing protein [bacterium]
MDADTTKLSKDIIQQLIKSKKNLRMYPENNPIYIKTIESTFALFKDYYDYRDELPLKIKQFEVLSDGEQVYYNPGKDDNFALFFFKDGIREIIFRNGLTKDELEDFLKIITADMESDSADDDIVTLMWERDFQHINYIVDETFLTDEDEYEETAVREVKEKAADETEVLKAYEAAMSEEEARYIPVVPLTDADIERLKGELDKGADYSVFKLGSILFEMLYLAETKDDLQDMVSFFRSAIDYALQYADLEISVRMLQKMDAVLNEENCPEEIKPYLRMVLGYISSERVLKLIGEILDSRAEVDEAKVNSLFSLMDKSAIPGLIRTLGEMNSIHARKAIINSLIILGKKDLAAVAKGLNDNRWYVVRNIIYVFRNIGDKRSVEYLVKKIRHEDIRVRKEIIKALGELGGTDVVQYLKSHIDDPDPGMRVLAAKSISQTGSPVARKILMEKISSSDLRSRDFGEKKEFFEALARWNDAEVVDFLEKILKKGSLFRRSRVSENRACAAYALGFIGNKAAADILKKFRGIKNDLVREYVNTALMRIERGIGAQRA